MLYGYDGSSPLTIAFAAQGPRSRNTPAQSPPKPSVLRVRGRVVAFAKASTPPLRVREEQSLPLSQTTLRDCEEEDTS